MPSVYQIKVTLEGSKPPIWRRIQVPANITLNDLHDVIQDTMGWTGAHLHQFVIGNTAYSDPAHDLDDVENELKAKLDRVINGVKAKFVYEYDFGDNWRHKLVVEKILEPEPGVQYPRCVAGARNGPPEDCGGIWGYAQLLETIQDPKHPEHAEMLEWVGGKFDPEAFDVDEVNDLL